MNKLTTLMTVLLLAASTPAFAITAFLSHSYVDGLYRTCVYDHRSLMIIEIALGIFYAVCIIVALPFLLGLGLLLLLLIPAIALIWWLAVTIPPELFGQLLAVFGIIAVAVSLVILVTPDKKLAGLLTKNDNKP